MKVDALHALRHFWTAFEREHMFRNLMLLGLKALLHLVGRNVRVQHDLQEAE